MKEFNSQANQGLAPLDWESLRRDCSPDSIRALERSLKALEAGQAPTPSFKLYGKTDVSVVTNFLQSLRKGDYPSWMLDYEDSRVSKFGPQGGHAPWKEIKDDFMLYLSRPTGVSYVDSDVIKEMNRDYRQLSCNMLSVTDTLAQLKNDDKILERAAGWNTFQLKKTDIAAQQEAIRVAKTGVWKKGKGYVFSRYNKLKKRIFMPMPFSLMLKQGQYYVPFLSGIQKDLLLKKNRSPFRFWAEKNGFKECFDVMSRSLRDVRFPNSWKIVYSQRDFEKMDTTTGYEQYNKLFVPSLDAAYHQAMPDMHEAMLMTVTAPIITPSGITTGPHGTASGAEVTNGGETVCNDYYDRRLRKILEDECNEKRIRYTLITTQGNGDDGTSVFAVHPADYRAWKDLYTAAADQAAKECGFRTQASKWRIDTDFGLYCQNMYWIEGNEFKFAYPAALILNSVINPEHQYQPSDWDKDYRDLDICEKLDNGVGLPYYRELVIYVDKGMKYPLLGRSEAETKRILSKYERYRQLQYQTENFNRRDWNPSSSPTVNLILGMR